MEICVPGGSARAARHFVPHREGEHRFGQAELAAHPAVRIHLHRVLHTHGRAHELALDALRCKRHSIWALGVCDALATTCVAHGHDSRHTVCPGALGAVRARLQLAAPRTRRSARVALLTPLTALALCREADRRCLHDLECAVPLARDRHRPQFIHHALMHAHTTWPRATLSVCCGCEPWEHGTWLRLSKRRAIVHVVCEPIVRHAVQKPSTSLLDTGAALGTEPLRLRPQPGQQTDLAARALAIAAHHDHVMHLGHRAAVGDSRACRQCGGVAQTGGIRERGHVHLCEEGDAVRRPHAHRPCIRDRELAAPLRNSGFLTFVLAPRRAPFGRCVIATRHALAALERSAL
mmetsp:Transcript_25668/g.66373  ORF Transcript_25668/g.66373 Transcript_25668/m.66373 type:complete len:349 (+) Transcript_25668:239-1285(+)